MFKIRLKIIFPLLILIFLSFKVYQDDRYKYSERKGRMEGLRKVPTDAFDLDLISFIAYRENFSLQSTKHLNIKFFLENNDNVYITAVNLTGEGRSNYQMKPLKTYYNSGWQEFNSWPIGDVIKPLGINPNNIGIIAKKSFDRPGSGIIVPIILYENNYPEQQDKYTIHLLPKNTLSYINYWVISIDDNHVIVPEDELTNKPANIPFKISFSLKGQKKGKYKLMISTEELGSTVGPDRYFEFYHL